MKSVIFLLIILSFFLVSCSPEVNCCQECIENANKDPSGYDVSIKPCSDYGLKCEFSVGECQEI